MTSHKQAKSRKRHSQLVKDRNVQRQSSRSIFGGMRMYKKEEKVDEVALKEQKEELSKIYGGESNAVPNRGA